MASSEPVHVLEHCRVAPPPATVDEKSLPLTFFDLPWLHSHLLETLFFYEFPHPKTHFLETILSNLKHSLSLALKHFYFLAGNLIFPPNFTKPEIRYKDGDSVSLIIAESSRDFHYLIGNHPRNVSEFHRLLPTLPSDELFASVMAIQVTIFPESGISLGFTFPHVVSDGSTFSQFLRLWASINKLGEDITISQNDDIVPFYDRTVVKDPLGIESIYWDQIGKKKFEGYRPRPSTDNVMATFVLSQADLRRLKRWVAAEFPSSPHLSSFTVACAYVWACMAKARAKSGGEDHAAENEPEHLAFVGDCRAYFDPPIPANYFGNCLAPCSATVKSLELIKEDGYGFLVAADAIGKAIQERLRNREGIMRGLEKWMSNFKSLNLKRIVGVAGSPKFSFYDIDFGFGRPCKGEVVSIDVTKSISISEGKNSKQDIEISLSFPKIKMDVFTSIFNDGFKLHS